MVSSKSTLTLRVHDHNVTLSPQLPQALKAKALGFDSFDDGPGRSSWHANAFASGHGRVTCPAKLTLGKSRRECLLVPERSRYPPAYLESVPHSVSVMETLDRGQTSREPFSRDGSVNHSPSAIELNELSTHTGLDGHREGFNLTGQSCPRKTREHLDQRRLGYSTHSRCRIPVHKVSSRRHTRKSEVSIPGRYRISS